MYPRVVVAVADDALRHEALTYCRFLASTNTVEVLDGPATESAIAVPFDLLILDADLPGIAVEAMLARFSASTDSRRRVLLLTSRPVPAIKHPLVVDTLSKPVRIDLLLLALDRWRDSPPAPSSQNRPLGVQSSTRQP